jgi:DNA-binding HxlR family transcriptional regulator
LACYVYIRFRCGISRNIQTSIESFKNAIGLSEKTITNSLKELEELNLINIKRFKPIIKDGEFCEKESNIYSLKEKKEHGNKEN